MDEGLKFAVCIFFGLVIIGTVISIIMALGSVCGSALRIPKHKGEKDLNVR